MAGTRKIRLTRSIRLNGEKGEIHELPLEMADWLIAQGSAEPLGVVARIVGWMMTPKRRGEE
jgi:hypothetical protein